MWSDDFSLIRSFDRMRREELVKVVNSKLERYIEFRSPQADTHYPGRLTEIDLECKS